MNAPVIHQFAEMADEERAEECGDVRAVGVGVGKNADLAVPKPAGVLGPRIDAEGHRDVVDLLR